MNPILITMLFTCTLYSYAHVERLYLNSMAQHFTTNLNIGNYYSHSFCIDITSPYTLVPTVGCSDCIDNLYNCTSSCMSKGDYVYYSDEYLYASGYMYSDNVYSTSTSREFSASAYFIGLSHYYNYDNDNLNSCTNVLGLNFLYPTYSFNSYEPLYVSFGYNKVIGLHFPHDEISLNGYVSSYINGSIKYFDVYNDGSNLWKVQFIDYSIDGYYYNSYNPVVEFSTTEKFIAMPSYDYQIFYNKFCNYSYCNYYSYGYYYNMVYVRGNSSNVMEYSIGNIEINIDSKTKITLYPSDYINIGYNSSDGKYFAILLIRNKGSSSWVLGNMVLQKMNLVLDAELNRIGFVVGSKVSWIAMLTMYIASGVIVVAAFIIGCCCCKRKMYSHKVPLIQQPYVDSNVTLR